MSARPSSGPRPLAELAFDLVTPACRRRGVANAALLLDPAELFGARFARSAAVERIVWPKGATVDGGSTGATLVIHADSAAALALQHVAPQVIERANTIIGWAAIARLRITQATSRRTPRAAPLPAPVDPSAAAAVAATLDVAHPDLKAALGRLGAGVKRRSLSGGRNSP
jgi:hypothetical protein